MLGISAADPSVLARYQAAGDAPSSYLNALSSLVLGDFRTTLDGVRAWQTLIEAIAMSLPRLGVSNAILALTVLLVLQSSPESPGWLGQKALELIAFFPPFLPGLLLFSLLAISGLALVDHEGSAMTLLLGACIGASPACLAAAIIRASSREQMGMQYIVSMRAQGYSERGIARAIRKAVFLPCISSAEKILLMQISLLIFCEAIFSAPGFGSAVILAVQRNDVNTLLLAVTLISSFVALVRAASRLASFGLDPRRR